MTPIWSAMRVARLLVLFLLLGSFAGTAAAQAVPTPVLDASPKPMSWQGSIGYLHGSPSGEFAQVVSGGAHGFSLQVDRQLRKSPLSVGGNLGWTLYGSESRTVNLGSLIPEVPSASVKVNTENGIVFLLARMRAQRLHGRWRPYVDALLGFSDIYTLTTVEGGSGCNQSGCETGNLGSESQANDLVGSYGVGTGLMWGLTKTEPTARLDIGIHYLRGGRARYLTKGAIRVEGSETVLDFSESRTDLLTVYIGVAFGR
jgi:hypothetical protein